MFQRVLRPFLTLTFLIIFFIISYILIRTYSQNGQRPEPQDQSYQINEKKRISMLFRYKRDSSLKIYEYQEGHSSLVNHSESSTPHFNENFYGNETLWPWSTKEILIKSKRQTKSMYGYKGNHSHFYVYNSRCKMPRPDPFSPEAMTAFYKPHFMPCSNEDDLISVRFDTNLQQYRLHVNNETFEKITKHKLNKDFICYYNHIPIKGDSSKITSTIYDRVYFNQDILIPRTVSNLFVACFTSNDSISIQKDAFALVQMPNITAETKIKSKKDVTETRKPSVIMLGLDTMSRMNLPRTMPKTAAFLNKTGWFEMQGYNKIGDNTYPNLLAVFTGYTDKDANNVCNTDKIGCHDKLPFVWKYFKKFGYKTAYAEDLSAINTFNYLKPGFLWPPVDYYLRSLLVVIEYTMNYVIHFGFKYCVGRRLSISYVLDYCVQFVERFITNATIPAFGFFWSSSVTHDHNFGAASIDDKFHDYLKHYERLKLFEQAIVIFFSDHGHRFGRLRDLSEGYLEERLPILFIWLPPWFREKYPHYVTALRQNRNCLSSPFDLHMTLKHIVELGHTSLKFKLAHSCTTCQSLFRPLSKYRGCSQAGIGEHFCACDTYMVVANNLYVGYVAKKIVYQMNIYVATTGLIDQCETLKFHRIIMTQQKWIYNNTTSNIITYRIQFETLPPKGKFEATITINRKSNMILNLVVPHISRLNSYQNDSLCINHKIAKKFCFCYNRKISKVRERIDKSRIVF